MEKAVDELTKCRLTLKWSYAMAYFLAKGNDKEIFEDLQAYVIFCSRRFEALYIYESVTWRRP